MKNHPAHLSSRPRGYLLLLVLVFVFMTSVVVVSLLESSLRNLRSAAAASARDDLRVAAFSAMEISLATLAEIKELDDKLMSPNQGWGDAISYAPIEWPDGLKVKVTIKDETGKLPLDPPDRDVLSQLFDQMGISYSEADKLIDAYLDWVDEDDLERLNGAESDYYRTQTPERDAPNAPITSYESFRYIKGFDELFFDENGAPNKLFQYFKESTSLKHGHTVNVNTASPLVRTMLEETAGLDVRSLEDLELGLDGEAGTADDRWYDPDVSSSIDPSSGFGSEAHMFRIIVEVSQGEQHFQLNALVDDGTSAEESSTGGSRANGESGEGGGEGNGGSGNNSGNGNSGGSGNGGSSSGGVPPGGNNFGQIDDFFRPGAGNDQNNDRPQEDDGEESGDDENRERGSSGGGSTVIYSNGEWRILQLTENGAEDG